MLFYFLLRVCEIVAILYLIKMCFYFLFPKQNKKKIVW